jgi:hypothetical protein
MAEKRERIPPFSKAYSVACRTIAAIGFRVDRSSSRSTCSTVAQTCWRRKFKHCGTLFGRCGCTRPSASTPGSSFPTICTSGGPCRQAMPTSPVAGARSRRILEGFGRPRVAIAGHDRPWRTRVLTTRDDRDFAAHVDYTHFNPVKHGLVKHPAGRLHSSFPQCVARGLYPAGWIGDNGEPLETDERR